MQLSLGGAESALHGAEQIALLPSSVADEVGIDVVGVLGAPLNESLVIVSHGRQGDLTDDGGDRDGGLSHDQLVSDGVVPLRELGDSPVPGGAVDVADLDDGVDSACVTLGPLGARDDGWGELLKLPVSDLVPDVLDLGGDDRALSVGGRAGDHGLDALEEDFANSGGHLGGLCFSHLVCVFWFRGSKDLQGRYL